MVTPLHIVALGEARELLSVLRCNRRFGYFLSFTAASQPSEHPFVKEIKLLRDIILENNKEHGATAVVDKGEPLISEPDLRRVLEPFLHVITSRDASGLITGVALLCVDRIMSSLFHLIASNSDYALWKTYAPTLNIVIDAVSACRFDVTDPAADEVVLARITSALVRIATSPAVPHLSDASMLRGIEACIGIASGRRRASELLRRTAESALCEIMSSLGKSVTNIADSESEEPSMDTIRKSYAVDISTSTANGATGVHSFNADSFGETGPLSGAVITAVILVACRMIERTGSSASAESLLGLQVIANVLTFGGESLVQIASVKQVLLRDCCRAILRCVGSFKSPLPVIAAAFTASRLLVHVLGQEATALLAALLGDVYPCYISGLENVRSVVNGDSIGKKVQGLGSANGQLSRSASRLNGATGPGKSSDLSNGLGAEIDPVVREIGLESLADLLSAPGLLSALYGVADCDLKSDNVVGPLLVALGQASHSSRPRKRSKRLRASSSGSTRMSAGAANGDSDDDESVIIAGGNPDSIRFARSAALLCAEAVLAVVHTIKQRLNIQSDGTVTSSDGVGVLREKRLAKAEKIRCEQAAMAFNADPKINKASKLITFLRDLGSSKKPGPEANVQEELDNDIASCVQFLRETRGINKEMIGAILGEPDELSRRVLEAFTATFDFRNRRFTDSLRVFLESFRLPGESQKILRIMECFSNSFYNQNRAPLERSEEDPQPSEANAASLKHSTIGLLQNADSALTLSYAVVMLNTDLHNVSIRRKMNLDSFVHNLRDQNDGENFPRWFLAEIFDSIASVEIRMKDEAGMDAMTSVHWDEILGDMQSRKLFLTNGRDAVNFDEDIFSLCWQSAVAAANVTLIEAGDANQAQKALEGFVSVSRCATAFRQSRPVDVVVASLVNSTNILDGPLNGAVFRFGTDIKAQMAAVALSDVSRQCADWMRSSGWQAVISYALRLHALCLLPDELEKSLGCNGTDLEVSGQLVPASHLVPAWWPSQSHRKGENEHGEDDRPKRSSRPKGLFAALFAAAADSDVSSDEDGDVRGASESERNRSKRVRISHSPPTYIKLRRTEEIEAQKLARKCIVRCRVEDILISEAKILRSDALHCLSRAIARAAGRILDGTKSYPDSNSAEQFAPENKQDFETLDDVSFISDGVSGISVPLSNAGDSGVLNFSEFSPSSPPADSSAIVGVAAAVRSDSLSMEFDGDYRLYSDGSWTGAVRERDERKAREFVVAFCVDVLCNLTLQNRDRLHIPWPALHAVLVRIIAPATRPSALLERSIIALLRVATRLLHRDELRSDVLRTLNLIVRLPPEATSALSVPIAAGLYNLVKSHGSHIASTSGWHAIFSIIESMARCSPGAVDIALKLLSFVLAEKSSLNAVCLETFAPVLDAVMAFVTLASVDSSLQALDLLFLLSQRIRSLVQTGKIDVQEKVNEDSDASGYEGILWAEFWGPLLKGFSTAARDPRGKVRNQALVALEKVIAVNSASDFLTAVQWKVALSTVIFPLMKKLFTTHGFLEATIEAERAAQRRLRIVSSASSGGKVRSRSVSVSADHDEQLIRSVLAACGKTRLRAVMLTSKTFLQHHSVIAAGLPREEFTDLWLGVLDVFRIALQGDGDEPSEAIPNYSLVSDTDELQEHVPENVKNMLLVMCDCGLLSEADSMRWNATFSLIRTFLPNNAEDIESLATISASQDSQTIPVSTST